MWLSDVRTASFLLEQDAIVTATNSRAVFGQEVMSRFTRDLHLYTRTAGWLLFGAVARSPSLTDMRSGAEECKMYPEGEDDPICPFKVDEVPCACDWNDNFATEGTCTIYPMHGMNSSRYIQSGTVEGQKNDADPFTGNRPPKENRTVYDQPSKTNWWASFDEMPGVYKGENASGFNTTYDRVRTLSAMATVEFPIYNYFPGRDESKHLGMYIGIGADGMVSAAVEQFGPLHSLTSSPLPGIDDGISRM